MLLLAVVAGDAVLPVLPGETMVIAAAVLAAQGHLDIVFVVVAAAFGALLGDNAAYGIGHSGLRRVADRLLRTDKNRHHLEWARTQLQHHGVWIIIVARFIRGGRTATTYVAGTVGMRWKRQFLPADAIAAATWSLYASALGYLGGASFEDNFWLPMLIGAAASASWVGPSGNRCIARCSTEARRRETAHPALGRRAAPRRRNARLRTSRCRPRVQRQKSTLSGAPRAALPGDGAAGPLRDSELSHWPSAIYVFATVSGRADRLPSRARGPRVLGRVAGYLPLRGGNFDRPRRTAVLYTRE